MELRSLGYRTDLIFPRFDGEVIDRGDYLVVRSPLNPTFYWGNFLLFAAAPQPGDLDRWRDLFAQEIGSPPVVKHLAFGWDATDGATGQIQPFIDAGFALERNVVVTSTAPRPPARPASHVTIRHLSSDSDWANAVEVQVLGRDPEHEEEGYRIFRQHAMQRYRTMEAAGLGHWYGAFVDNRLVADLGLFHDGHGLGRYQSVQTHPDFRRQGIAGTLVFEAGRSAMTEHGLHTLVIVAEDDSSPSRLYHAVGFTPTEKTMGVLWWDGKPRSSPPD